MAKWTTVAPNGNFVYVSTGSNVDAQFKNGQIITDRGLAELHPTIFIMIEDDEKPKQQILTEVTPPKVEEVVEEKPEVLVEEAPQEEKVEEEVSKPTRRTRSRKRS